MDLRGCGPSEVGDRQIRTVAVYELDLECVAWLCGGPAEISLRKQGSEDVLDKAKRHANHEIFPVVQPTNIDSQGGCARTPFILPLELCDGDVVGTSDPTCRLADMGNR